MMDDGDQVQKLQVEMAGLRADIKYLSQGVRTLTQKLELTPTPRDYEALNDRLTKAEGNLNKAAWAIITAWIGGIGTVFWMLVRH